MELMKRLALASDHLQRKRRHDCSKKHERGAAVFVVIMVIMMLSALGTWSMHAAGLVDRASGFNRASMQTQYVTELGLLTSSGLLAVPGIAETNIRRLDHDPCYSATKDPSNSSHEPFCKSIFIDEVLEQAQELSNKPALTILDDGNAGSLSPFASTLQGFFRVEVTDSLPVQMAGNALGSGADIEYWQVTLTSYGTVRPDGGVVTTTGDLCVANGAEASSVNSTAGRIGMRAHAVIGPFPRAN